MPVVLITNVGRQQEVREKESTQVNSGQLSTNQQAIPNLMEGWADLLFC